MAQARFAAMRAQRQQQQADAPQTVEMSNLQVNGNGTNASGNGNGNGSVLPFLSEIESVQDGITQLSDNVRRISELHSRSLNAMDESAAAQEAAQLDALAVETRILSNQLKDRIKALEATPNSGHDAEMRRNRTSLVRKKFLEAIQDYQKVEQQYRTKAKQRVERQFRIVKPDATPEEISTVVNDADGGGNQIFAQALSSTTRYGDSRAAYREVQERHQDIRKMEATLAELAQLFNDMGTMIEQQDATIVDIEKTAATVEDHTEQGAAHIEKAVVHARAWRKKKWICFFIILIICAIIAIVLGVELGGKK